MTVLCVVISELGRERELKAMPGFSLDSSETRKLYLERQRRESQQWQLQECKEGKTWQRCVATPEGRGHVQGRRWKQWDGHEL